VATAIIRKWLDNHSQTLHTARGDGIKPFGNGVGGMRYWVTDTDDWLTWWGDELPTIAEWEQASFDSSQHRWIWPPTPSQPYSMTQKPPAGTRQMPQQ
jgi:hypothetical protein